MENTQSGSKAQAFLTLIFGQREPRGALSRCNLVCGVDFLLIWAVTWEASLTFSRRCNLEDLMERRIGQFQSNAGYETELWLESIWGIKMITRNERRMPNKRYSGKSQYHCCDSRRDWYQAPTFEAAIISGSEEQLTGCHPRAPL